MNALLVFISALTAFVIAAGGSLAIAFLTLKGNTPDRIVWISAGVLGLISAAKDTRSLLKLPPVNGGTEPPKTP